ncbi:MAG TPA: class I SAM-dependent methyltransferase [Ktedonobacteraceae bacterium]|nr:class I SAM-dependent methyltransferase [Ktedonobacteraceae bacterium]
MSTPPNPRREHPSTYVVPDRSTDENTRLQLQDQMITASMGGVLPEQSDRVQFKRILDVGCGTGGWLIESAKTYPTMTELVGVDVSAKMVEYAQAQAEEQQVSDRVQFRTMDALRMLEFPVGYFDLVNQRFGISYLRKWDWPKLLQEYQRVTRSGGVIRITETDIITETSSPALLRLDLLLMEALAQAGHLFTAERDGLTSQLANLMRQHGLQNIQTRACDLVYRAGTPEGHMFHEDMKQVYRNFLPFLRKWTRVPEDYETLYQQMLSETQQADFVATWNVFTAWGNAPVKTARFAPSTI